MTELRLDLVSPERLIMSRTVEMVVMPGSAGYFGVLAEHAPMATSLKPGLIGIFDGGKLTEKLFIPGGFAEVNDNVCTILADEVGPVEDLNLDQLKKDLAEREADKDEVDLPETIKLRAIIESLENADALYV